MFKHFISPFLKQSKFDFLELRFAQKCQAKFDLQSYDADAIWHTTVTTAVCMENFIAESLKKSLPATNPPQ